MIYDNAWSSVVVFARGIITAAQAKQPAATIQFIDWEAHANVNELPNADLIGPTAVSISEVDDEIFEMNFSIAVSTHGDDANLFRLRDYISLAFERMRPKKQMKFYDAEAALEKSVFIFTPGTMVAPMTRSEVRPWQFVQASCLLLPEPAAAS